MKKFLVALMVAVLALSAVALADKMDVASNHAYNYSTGKLDCALSVANQAPTCDEEGWCMHADETYYVLKKLDHVIKPGTTVQTKDPTCDEYGEETHTCALCGASFTTKVGFTSHVVDFFWLVKPSCSNVGIAAKGCPGCGEYTESYTWWNQATTATPKDPKTGKAYIWDARCAKIEGSNKPEDHTGESAWLIISEKTCYNPLVKQAYCTDCQSTLTVVEPKKPHDFGTVNLVLQNNPDCDSVAVYAYVKSCKNCDYYETTYPAGVGNGIGSFYNWNTLNGNSATDQIAVAEINKLYTNLNKANVNVQNDGAYYVERSHFVVKYLGGSGIEGWERGHHVADPATLTVVKDKVVCTDKKNTKFMTESWTCKVCKTPNAVVKQTALEVPAHNWTAYKEIVAPTEDTNFIGKWTRYCMNEYCGTIDEYIGGVCGTDNHLEGEPEYENVVEATYTKDGSAEEVVYCVVCEKELSRKEVVLPMLEGINPDDNTLYEDGKASTETGIVTFNGKDYYLINGVKQESMGATLVGDTWYFMAHGIVQEVTQLAEYNGAWFVVKGGKIDITFNGLVEYDGAEFLVAAGRIVTEATTLYNDGTQWLLISAGKVATEYTGSFSYDGQVFEVVNGIVK